VVDGGTHTELRAHIIAVSACAGVFDLATVLSPNEETES
jgi:hypothetical protein